LKHQSCGGIDFQWRDRNLSAFMKISPFVFQRLTKLLWVVFGTTWRWIIDDRI